MNRYLSTYLSIYLSIYLSFIYPSLHPSINKTYSIIYLKGNKSTFLLLYLLSDHQPVTPFCSFSFILVLPSPFHFPSQNITLRHFVSSSPSFLSLLLSLPRPSFCPTLPPSLLSVPHSLLCAALSFLFLPPFFMFLPPLCPPPFSLFYPSLSPFCSSLPPVPPQLYSTVRRLDSGRFLDKCHILYPHYPSVIYKCEAIGN